MLLKREREARLTRRSSYSWPLPSSATVMPQNGVFENHNLWMTRLKERLILAIGGVANLIHATTGRANEHWNVVGSVALTFCSELILTPAGILSELDRS